MKVKLTDRVVDVEVVRMNTRTMWVRLPDGNVIKRHKRKHVASLDERFDNGEDVLKEFDATKAVVEEPNENRE